MILIIRIILDCITCKCIQFVAVFYSFTSSVLAPTYHFDGLIISLSKWNERVQKNSLFLINLLVETKIGQASFFLYTWYRLLYQVQRSTWSVKAIREVLCCSGKLSEVSIFTCVLLPHYITIWSLTAALVYVCL